MRDRLTIVRPAALGSALAEAIRDIDDRDLRAIPAHTPLLEARLAGGDFESVRALLRDTPGTPALPLFLARYVRWSGDLHTATAAWDRTLEALARMLDAGTEAAGEDAWLRWRTASELAATATDLGDAPLAARLHRIARETTADHAPDRAADHAAPAPTAPARSVPTPDAAVARVHEAAFEVLGIEPDAYRGRIRLRPALDRFDAIEARSIRFADGAVSIGAQRADGALVIRVAQDSGSIPLTLLLEPFLPGPGVTYVDGQPADLEVRVVDGRAGVQVQLVLDEERELTVRPAGGEGQAGSAAPLDSGRNGPTGP